MSKIPNGVQPHVLFDMDGRQWIESQAMAGNINRAIERGWALRIPQDKIDQLVKETLDASEADGPKVGGKTADLSHEYMEDRCLWLRETLIPDLRESECDATADDFEMCVTFIEQLLMEIEED